MTASRGRGKERRAAKAARAASWRVALAEGRIVRHDGGFTEYRTPEAAREGVAARQAAGDESAIVVKADA